MRKIKIERAIVAEDTVLGAGAMLKLELASPPIIKLLRSRYLEDETCLSGDIEFLFDFDGSGMKEKENFFKP